jgi:hypothetical protein
MWAVIIDSNSGSLKMTSFYNLAKFEKLGKSVRNLSGNMTAIRMLRKVPGNITIVAIVMFWQL